MKIRPKLFLTGPLTIVIGILVFLLGTGLTIKSQDVLGIILLTVALLFLTYGTEFIIDPETSRVTRSRKIFFIKLSSMTIQITPDKGKIELIDSTDELFGIDRKSSTFFTYDVIYRKANNHRIYIFTSTSNNQANKVAEFFSKNLNITLDLKSISR